MNNYDYRVNLVDDYLKKLNLSNEIKEYYYGRNILVTGGAGAIGSNLVTALSRLVGDDGMIIVLDNLSAIKGDEPIDLPPLSNMMFVKGDVRSDIDLKSYKTGHYTSKSNITNKTQIKEGVDILLYGSMSIDIDNKNKRLYFKQNKNTDRLIESGIKVYYDPLSLVEKIVCSQEGGLCSRAGSP